MDCDWLFLLALEWLILSVLDRLFQAGSNNAPNETATLSELEIIKEKWGKKYPYAISNWENNWEDVNSFFQFSGEIRRIMYTTNIIEGLNRQYRKVTKTKNVFPSDSALEKILYLASGWDQVLNQLLILYGERLNQYL